MLELPTKQKLISELSKLNHVITVNMRMSDTSKCQECKTNCDKYSVFLGGTMLSDLIATSCEKCLSTVTDAAILLRKERIETGIKNIEDNFKSQSNK